MYFSSRLLVKFLQQLQRQRPHICMMAAISLIAAVPMAKWQQQRLAPVLSPRLCQYGGCSRAIRRSLWRNSSQLAAVPVLAAAHFGDNFAIYATSAAA